MLLLLLAVFLLVGCQANPEAGGTDKPVASRLHTFYYPWYGTPEKDGKYIHWNHDVMDPDNPATFPGGDDIGADFFPQGGCYSSGDPEVLNRQMQQLQSAGVGVICVSWLGPDSFEAQVLPTIMAAAAEHGILVNFHLEPAVQQSIQTIREAIVFLTDQFGAHPAFYRATETNGRGLFYAYDSYKTPASEWARLLTTEGDQTIRGTIYDAAVVGLILNENDTGFIEAAGMDGGYSYFAVDGFSYGSTSANWRSLVAWAREKNLLFIPSVGPGYGDLRIRPWNQRNQRPRDQGHYYDRLFERAIDADPPIIAITSFNEWHEGTQIEPAVPTATDQFTYLDYQPLQPDGYLERTAAWAKKWSQRPENPGSAESAKITAKHLAVGKSIKLSHSFSEAYAAGGNGALVDGITGSIGYRDGCWQGFEGVDLVAEIDLGVLHRVSELSIGFLNDPQVWVFLPRMIRVEGSANGLSYRLLATGSAARPGNSLPLVRYEEKLEFKEQPLRFFKIFVDAEKICPPDHPSAGQPAWLFMDEIQISPEIQP